MPLLLVRQNMEDNAGVLSMGDPAFTNELTLELGMRRKPRGRR